MPLHISVSKFNKFEVSVSCKGSSKSRITHTFVFKGDVIYYKTYECIHKSFRNCVYANKRKKFTVCIFAKSNINKGFQAQIFFIFFSEHLLRK